MRDPAFFFFYISLFFFYLSFCVVEFPPLFLFIFLFFFINYYCYYHCYLALLFFFFWLRLGIT
ncbi:hypothetical protein LI328DRAFT_132877 [Trichoderma asperelloides]|nr:hypothetical protein LI328DRAFT_132877 [Trichoderma asperelloides]